MENKQLNGPGNYRELRETGPWTQTWITPSGVEHTTKRSPCLHKVRHPYWLLTLTGEKYVSQCQATVIHIKLFAVVLIQFHCFGNIILHCYVKIC